MAFVSVPKDLTKIKSRIALGLTKRQLICFSAAAAIGIPVYICTRGMLGSSGAVLLMMGLTLPLFLLAMYEKDGMPAEKILRNIIRARFLWPGTRPYKTENLYEIIEREGKNNATQNQRAAKTPVGKRQAGKKQ